jgi:predicted adenine nucleotide alpha hydrolase (AANH) superfamily ATPase
LKLIKLKEFGFDSLANVYVMSREKSVNMLIDTLKSIEEVNQLKAFIELSKNKGLNDVAGIVTNLNAELEIKGFIIVL